MKEIVLTNGSVALIDDEDFDKISKYKWTEHKEGTKQKSYAISSVRDESGKYKQIRMHRLVLGISDPKLKIDHANGKTLDNTKSNIRVASNSQNGSNLDALVSTNTSGFRGVGLASGKARRVKPWCAKIRVNGKLVHLGYFASAQEAAKAYDAAAKKHFGEFCGKLNYE